MKKSNKKTERKEIWMRILVGVVTGMILYIWAYLIGLFFIINFIYGIFKGKRLRDLSELSEIWNSQIYVFLRYMNFVSNKRPFPFKTLEKSLSKFN
jgi:hypothetical protein